MCVCVYVDYVPIREPPPTITSSFGVALFILGTEPGTKAQARIKRRQWRKDMRAKLQEMRDEDEKKQKTTKSGDDKTIDGNGNGDGNDEVAKTKSGNVKSKGSEEDDEEDDEWSKYSIDGVTMKDLDKESDDEAAVSWSHGRGLCG